MGACTPATRRPRMPSIERPNDFPCYPQESDIDCLPASVFNIAAYYDIECSPEDLRELLGTGVVGTRTGGLWDLPGFIVKELARIIHQVLKAAADCSAATDRGTRRACGAAQSACCGQLSDLGHAIVQDGRDSGC